MSTSINREQNIETMAKAISQSKVLRTSSSEQAASAYDALLKSLSEPVKAVLEGDEDYEIVYLGEDDEISKRVNGFDPSVDALPPPSLAEIGRKMLEGDEHYAVVETQHLHDLAQRWKDVASLLRSIPAPATREGNDVMGVLNRCSEELEKLIPSKMQKEIATQDVNDG